MYFSFVDLEECWVHYLCNEPTKECRVCKKHFGIKDLKKDSRKPYGVTTLCTKCHSFREAGYDKKRRARKNELNRERRNKLANWYVRDLFSKKWNFKAKDSPQTLIETQRELTKLKRVS